MTLDGSTSRTLILLVALVSVTVLTWHGTVDGAAYTGILGAVLGAVVHASGTRQGAQTKPE
jgi:hypothetical protein